MEKQEADLKCRWFQFAFVFIVIFAIVLWFREEIYTMTKDVQRHPILAGIESLQIHKYLGSDWVFGSAKDEDDEADVVKYSAHVLEQLSNATVAREVMKAAVNATVSAANRTFAR